MLPPRRRVQPVGVGNAASSRAHSSRGTPRLSNPSAARSSRLRWQMLLPSRNTTASRRRAAGGSAASRSAALWAAMAASISHLRGKVVVLLGHTGSPANALRCPSNSFDRAARPRSGNRQDDGADRAATENWADHYAGIRSCTPGRRAGAPAGPRGHSTSDGAKDRTGARARAGTVMPACRQEIGRAHV